LLATLAGQDEACAWRICRHSARSNFLIQLPALAAAADPARYAVQLFFSSISATFLAYRAGQQEVRLERRARRDPDRQVMRQAWT
jgi:hypothetical protein